MSGEPVGGKDAMVGALQQQLQQILALWPGNQLGLLPRVD